MRQDFFARSPDKILEIWAAWSISASKLTNRNILYPPSQVGHPFVVGRGRGGSQTGWPGGGSGGVQNSKQGREKQQPPMLRADGEGGEQVAQRRDVVGLRGGES